MIDDGRITKEMHEEIKKHEDLKVFDAMIFNYVCPFGHGPKKGGRYNV